LGKDVAAAIHASASRTSDDCWQIGRGECRPVRAASIGVRATAYVGQWRSGGSLFRNMLVNSCIGANRLLLTRGRCVPRSDRTTDQWSSHRPIDIHCKRLSGRVFGTSLRRGKMPAKSRRRSCPWRQIWQTPDRGVFRSARRWRAALRTDRRGRNKCVVQLTKSA
jgi:hypothetical protein